MTAVFHKILRPILILSKCIGLINISYTVESTGLLVQNTNSAFHGILEMARMIVLFLCTYTYFHQFDPEFHIFQILNIIKLWIIIIAARLSTPWIIKFINGIIEFDRKIAPFSINLLIPQRSWRKKQWDMIFISLFVYFIGFKSLYFYFLPIKIENVVSLLIYYLLFTLPFVIDYVVTISSCFFLQSLYVRFQTLNDFWKCLPTDLVDVSRQWTHTEIVDFMENTRLLHSELCGLLKTFTRGYGSLLLGFFASSFINLLLSVYFIVNNGPLPASHSSANVWEQIIPLIIHVQMVTFLMFIIVFVSFINEKKMEMISYLRLYRISNLHLDIKRQIKMFMNQISACDSNQISAFGFFDINLNLVTTILVLLITGIITLIQMKDHPIILKLNNDTKSFLGKL
ncbi:uncharacterized protein LOC132926921 [Rhopalosiphum padi]|uniref:uncharacterized protein LOC132926921 n=1 Tax=Rhopalosiphum padi TaxID=40932 RepID=UPI00298E02FB|nr:uncharacterized protein LOC132926921 [Rhopalosiphum padi]